MLPALTLAALMPHAAWSPVQAVPMRLGALACLLALLPLAAAAQTACMAHEAMTAILADRWGETRRAIMLDAAGRVVEVYASAETGTWTFLVTRPGGPTCIVSSGQAYEAVAEPLPGDPA